MWEGGFDDLVCEPDLSVEPAAHVPGGAAPQCNRCPAALG